MSLEAIHLRKLLAILYSSNSERRAALRSDIRHELRKIQGEGSGGGDFHSPFWNDAKGHVAGTVDLEQQTKFRIGQNGRRARLYPQLRDGFLSWWHQKRRWRNEPFDILPDAPKGQHDFLELNAVVKVENLLALKVGGQENRIIYPYFAESPVLPAEGARLGLWLLCEAIGEYQSEEIRILDVLRGSSFGTIDVPLDGDEEKLFTLKYQQALHEWNNLWKEYH